MSANTHTAARFLLCSDAWHPTQSQAAFPNIHPSEQWCVTFRAPGQLPLTPQARVSQEGSCVHKQTQPASLSMQFFLTANRF